MPEETDLKYDIAQLLPHLKDYWMQASSEPGVTPSILLAMISPTRTEKGQESILKVIGTEQMSAIDTVAFSLQLGFRSLLRLVFESAKESGNEQAVNLPGAIVTLFSLQLESIGLTNANKHLGQAIGAIFTDKVTEKVQETAFAAPEIEHIERDPDTEQ